MDCCKKPKDKSVKHGILYGLLPHTGCIAFIIFSILGVTTATTLLRPLMMSAYFFYILIGVSIVFASISALIYLKKQNCWSVSGVKNKKKYLSVLYGTTVGINVLLFLVIFPLVANFTNASSETAGLSTMTLKVDIPCPGHSPLISNELKAIGVESIEYSFPDYFKIAFDEGKVSKQQILGLEVFSSYPAQIVEQQVVAQQQPVGCSSCNSCSGSCGGGCSV